MRLALTDLKEKYKGNYLLEIAKRGDGNNISYIICNENYEEILWQRDNKLNSEERALIGSSLAEKL